MKVLKIIVSVSLVAFCHSAIAQQSTLALYKYDIPNAVNEHNKLLNQHPVLNDKYKAGDTGKYEKALVASVLKLSYSTTIKTCICNEHYNAVDMYDSDSIKNIQTSFNHYLRMHKSGTLYHILNYDSNVCYTYYKYNDTLIENCRDISKGKLIKTGKSEKIGKWPCEEYSTDDRNGNKIFLWYSKVLPWYLNPGIYYSDIKAGLVRIKYKDVSITLYRAEKISTEVEWPKCRHYLAEPANLLQWCIENINSALGL